MGLLLWSIVTKQQPREPEVTFSHFLQAVDEGRVATVTIQGQNIRGVYKADRDGKGFKTFAPEDPDLVRMLRDKGVEIEARPEEAEPWYLVALVQWAPMLLLIGVWVFFMRQMQVGGGKAMSFGKSRAKLLSENTHKVTFNDVAARASAAATTSGSRRSTSCSSRWTASRRTRASSSSPLPTAPTCSIRRSSDRGASTGASSCLART